MRDPEDDEDALRWEGDEELGRATSLDRPLRPPGERAVDPARGSAAGDSEAVPAPRDLPLAVVTGIFAALYLAETVGWILVIQGVQAAGSFATGAGVVDFLGGIARFLALLAAPLWFVTATRLTRRRPIRAGWLALGTGLLVPWPLLLGLVA